MQIKKRRDRTKISLALGIAFFLLTTLGCPILSADPPDQMSSPTGGLQPEKQVPGLPPSEFVLNAPEQAAVKMALESALSKIQARSMPASLPPTESEAPDLSPESMTGLNPTAFVKKIGPRPKEAQRQIETSPVEKSGPTQKILAAPERKDFKPRGQNKTPDDLMTSPLPNTGRRLEFLETKTPEEKRRETSLEETERDKTTNDRFSGDSDRQRKIPDPELPQDIASKKMVGETDQNSDEEVVVDMVEYTPEIRATHLLLNPPRRFHPFLKWLFYADRLTPAMLELYYGALEKSDRMYKSAARSQGALRIRYQGKFLDPPVYLWPDQADGRYELVAMEGRVKSRLKAIPAVPHGVNPP